MLASEISAATHQVVPGLESKEDDATNTISEKARIFTCHFSLDLEGRIRKIGAEEDLFKLRQLNQNCYQMLNRSYFDIAQVSMYLGTKLSYIPTQEDPDESESNSKCIMLSAKTYYDAITYVKFIPQATFPWLKHIFRNFAFYYLTLDIKMIEICMLLYPYIINLDLKVSDLKDFSWTTFINQFTTLKALNLNIDESQQDNNKMPLDELDLSKLKLNPNIRFAVSTWHEEILTKFGTNPNTTFDLEITKPANDLRILRQFNNISTKFGHLTNIKFTKVKFEPNIPISNLVDLKCLTRLWLKHGQHIENLELILLISLSPTSPFQDEIEIKECLTSLSPFVTILRILWGSSIPQIVGMSCEWPKLSYFEAHLYGYESPLEILKHCPIMKCIKLNGLTQNLCFFSNEERSYEENLQDYFGNLSQLEGLVMKWYAHNIIKDQHLDDYLKGILPSIIHERYINETTQTFPEFFANLLD